MARKSGRVRASKAVYTEDPFAAAGISDEEFDDKPSKKTRRLKEESPSDDEFVGGDDDEDEDVDDEEMEDAAASEEDKDAEEEEREGEGLEGSLAGGMEMDVDVPVLTTKKKATASSARPRARLPDGKPEMDPNETHYRGGLDHNSNTSKEMLYRFAFGSDDRDLIAAIYQRDRWSGGADSCFPRRVTLEALEQGPNYKYGPTFGQIPENCQEERTAGWDWYYDREIGIKFRAKQKLAKLKKTDLKHYLAKLPTKPHTVLMGPTDRRTQIDLDYHEPYDYGKAWEDPSQWEDNEKPRKTAREGWLMSFGQKIQCLAWAPNQEEDTQYLAVVAPITGGQKKSYNSSDGEHRTAFDPTPAYPCAIQIWEFKGREASTTTNSLNMESKPQRRLVICTKWGDIRSIAWCPIPRDKRPEDNQEENETIGLLAGIWGDGKVRVLDVKLRRGSPREEYVQVTSPVFEARPSSTVCSCVTWLSPSDIAVGCSDGHVAIWSILPVSSPEPQPYFYNLIHSTWILSITSAYPTNPHLLCTISMDGETRLWSMVDPDRETSSTVRMRVAASHVKYSPVLQAVISVDENDFARMMPIRRFFASTAIARLPSSVTSLAPCSSWHPCMLTGGTGGEVTATNPLRKLLYTKEQQYQQRWFTHEWVAGDSTDSPGISRFFDGYKAESQVLAKNRADEIRGITKMSTTTIYEEGTHVTALDWNPNRRCAAWASAAMGCGLLRVEDLAI
ncbi:hypothetical protein PENSTE_c003G09984 [Penicillium steckii]|uniref:Uncharacterized protein n=1 Tax=Penicillium steckii TaxID=303698 RepID=A0A1V6TQN2_9EURO|nr:hypothetical protein PENSTE_c003G09984 [Penicillium steckii]